MNTPPRPPRSRLRKVAIWSLALLGTGAVLGAGTIASVFWYYGRGVEGIDVAAIRDYRPPQVTRIVARDGTVLGEIFSERRTLIKYKDIPTHVEHAFLAAEDADFYNHEGMDYFGMARAMLSNLEAGELRQGASTITQQVVKNFLLSPERTFERKIQELLLARRLEQALSKSEILELYLNEIYFGHGRYGIEEASRFYFNKSVRDINPGQAAILASMPKAPGKFSPIKDPQRVKDRQIYVLKQMVRHGWLAPQDAEGYIAAPLELDPQLHDAAAVPGAQEFVDAARERLIALYGQERLDRLGATVTTTVDLKLQAQARAGLRDGLVALDRRQGYGHKIKVVSEKQQNKALEKGREAPLQVGQTFPAVIQPRDAAVPEAEFAAKIGDAKILVKVPPRYDDPKLALDEQFPAGGITMVRVVALPGAEGVPAGWAQGEIGSGPQAAVVLADVETGEVLAMVGGEDVQRGDFNRALAAKRQPGSSFKPFVYGAALASQKYTAATLVTDSPEIYEKWKPTNFEADEYRGDIRLRVALTHSVNTIAIKLLDAIGFDAVQTFARAAGIRGELANNLALALGVSELTPVDLLTGYLTLARGGSYLEPTLIKKIEIAGEAPWAPERAPQQNLRDDVVFILTSMMTSVVEEGTARAARSLGRPVAGKTGTSAEHRDAWFAGYTPRHVAVAWVGFDVPKKIGKGETGGKAALPMWIATMQAAEAGQPPLPFVPPATVQVRTIDKRTGLLAPPDAKPEDVMEEYFIAGTEPIETAEPAALPTGDVVLDLYGDGDENADAAPAPGTPTPAEPGEPAKPGGPTKPDGDTRGGLPGVHDDPG